MKYDILIIGSGGAGLSSALQAKEKGANVLVVSEGYPTRSQTCMAQGGINGALGNVDDDSVLLHIEDTLKASANLASKKMVESLCKDALPSIEWLESIGVPFSRTEDAKIAQRRLGGASNQRACYSQDYTGLKILHTLYDQALRNDISFLHEHFLLDLSVKNNHVNGAVFYDIRDGKVIYIEAKSVILASGGYGGIYYRYTTNTNQSTGDGVIVAFRAGAKLSNMEFIQFHPTGLKDSGILISESARGAGGKLVNTKGERFVDELSARDKVSRAIWLQMQKGEDIFLDIRHLGEEYIDENIPQERKLCLTYAGVDPVNELIPIMPVAHYSMGGVWVDENMMSSIDGLFCVGECANAHVHGANRLGGNSLLEIISFGKKAGNNAYIYAKENNFVDSDRGCLDKNKRYIEQILSFQNSVDFYEKREFFGKLFYTNAGIIKEEKMLESALVEIEKNQKTLSSMGVIDHGNIYNTNLIERIKFENMLELSKVMLISALNRKESRGAHYRQGYPKTLESYAKESIAILNDTDIKIYLEEVLS